MMPKRSQAGYSLLEVIVAFAVMATVLSVLIPGQTRLLARNSTSVETLSAYDYARSRLNYIGKITPLEPGVTDDIYRDWIIEEEIVEAPAPNPNMRVYEITITLRSQTGRILATLQAIKSTADK